MYHIFCGKSLGQPSSKSWFDYRSYTKTSLPMNVAIFNDHICTLEESLHSNIGRELNNSNNLCTNFEVLLPPILIIDVVSSIICEPANLHFPVELSTLPPSEIKFGENFDFSQCIQDFKSPFQDGVVLKYNLVSTLSSIGQQKEFALYFRKNLDSYRHWHGGMIGSDINRVEKNEAIDENFFRAGCDVHPRILVYTRENFHQYLQESSCIQWKGKANMMHSISDKSNLIETSDKVLSVEFQKSKDSKSSYDNGNGGSNGVEKSIKRDINDRVDTSAESSNIEDEDKEVEMENSSHISPSSSLNHSALEEQADLALANRRLKDASDIYTRALKASSSQSSSSSSLREITRSLEEKREKVSHLMKVDSSTSLIEKGERALSRGAYTEARAHYAAG